MAHHGPTSTTENGDFTRSFLGVFRFSGRALELVWSTSRGLTLWLGLLTLVSGLLPAGIAYVGALIVDAVVAASRAVAAGDAVAMAPVFWLIALEAVLVMGVAGAQRGLSLCQSLLRAQLGQRVNVMILEKALTLQLAHFEDSEFYDKLTRARREASSRPLSLAGSSPSCLTQYTPDHECMAWLCAPKKPPRRVMWNHDWCWMCSFISIARS